MPVDIYIVVTQRAEPAGGDAVGAEGGGRFVSPGAYLLYPSLPCATPCSPYNRTTRTTLSVYDP